MPLSLTIPKRLNYPPSMDYTLLRREGMLQLERLGSAVWTDFNSHDPGVTMLEVLCYALTDLGYRTHLPEADLFTPSGNRKAFFTAAEILPNAPVTALDFRKILIDTEGIKNAWLEGCVDADVLFHLKLENIVKIPQEWKRYMDVFAPNISFDIAFNKTRDNLLLLKKIYQAQKKGDKKLVEKLQSAFYSKLYQITPNLSNPDGESFFKASTLYFIETNFTFIENLIQKIINPQASIEKKEREVLNNFRKIQAELKVFWQDNAKNATKIDDLWKLTRVLLEPENDFFVFSISILTNILLKESLIIEKRPEPPTPIDYTLFNPRGIYKVYLQLEEGYEAMADSIRYKALQRLHENRALSEDFDPDITVVDKAPIGINTTIELTPEADLTKVYADILFAIEEFLSPTLKMYSLQEMLDKYARFELTDQSFENLVDAELPSEVLKNLEILRGVKIFNKAHWTQALLHAIGVSAMEDYEGLIFNETEKIYESNPIFQGPLLKHGFIDDTELENANWRRTVYKSDLFQVISKVEGVVRVQRLDIHKCPTDDENPLTVEHEWCLSFDCHCQPSLDLDNGCSSFSFTKGGNPVSPNSHLIFEVSDRLEQLRGQNAKIDRSKNLDLPIPKGKQRDDLAEYTSIQEEFPKTYHVGNEGIVSTETPPRKAQVKQMKGFLMFFDQILTNYLAHLAQVRDVLAIESTDEKLHLYQPIYDAPKAQDLFMAFDSTKDTWENFIKKPEIGQGGNAYIRALQSLTNGSDITQKMQQNALLDHLLARFGEAFTDHVLELFKIERPLKEEAAGTEGVNDWLADKRRFLKNLPDIGSLRGRGFNYRAEPLEENRHFWKSDNIEGFKRRVFARVGIENWQRDTISCSPNFYLDTLFEVIRKVKRYRFGIKPSEDAHSFWLTSTALYGQLDAAEKAADLFFSGAADVQKYRLISEGSFHYVGFWEAGTLKDDALLLSEPFKELGAATQLLIEIKQHIEQFCQSNNFHIVEHILLRPVDEHYLPLKPLVSTEDLSRLDAYSFYITIVVPDWVDLFEDEKQYAYFQQTVRSEVPVHIALRFAKLDRPKLLDFEQTYFNWLKMKTAIEPQAFDVREATNELVKFLNAF